MTTLTWKTAGESHGPALIGILEGLPGGLALSTERIDAELARRWRGYGRGGRAKIETDRVEVLSGMRAGRTLGSPLCLRLANKDSSIESLPVPKNPRPGHADLAGRQKFTHRDPRAILERASARETAMRVALAGAARQLLEAFDVEVFGYLRELGGVAGAEGAFERAGAERGRIRDESDFLALDAEREADWRAAVDGAKEARDTLGGIFEVRALGLPPGLGSHASGPERLTGRLAGALMAIPAK